MMTRVISSARLVLVLVLFLLTDFVGLEGSVRSD